MAREIIECVPNFSEGRRKAVVDAIVAAIASVPGTKVLDVEMDPDHNRALPDIRKGEFEGLREAIKKDPSRAPDFGPRELHPTAGATVVGARAPLIAFNVNLGTPDVKVAKNIAKAIRESDGGLKYVRAKGFELKDRGIVQVSMNMTNYKGTPLSQAYELIKVEAERYGVAIVGSEIVGLVPLEAIVDVAAFFLKLEDFKTEQILETRLLE